MQENVFYEAKGNHLHMIPNSFSHNLKHKTCREDNETQEGVGGRNGDNR